MEDLPVDEGDYEGMQVVLKKMPSEWKRMLENERKCREVLNKYKKASNKCRKIYGKHKRLAHRRTEFKVFGLNKENTKAPTPNG
jgi:hypothetical protein